MYRKNSTYYIRKGDEVARLPKYLADTLLGREDISYICGPFVFFNGFEDTKEGLYLRKVFPYYFCMSPRTKEKVEAIMKEYKWWVRPHTEYINTMKGALR